MVRPRMIHPVLTAVSAVRFRALRVPLVCLRRAALALRRMRTGPAGTDGRMPANQPHATLRKRSPEGSDSGASERRTAIMPTGRSTIHAAWRARTRRSSTWRAACRPIRTSELAWSRLSISSHRAWARREPETDDRLSHAAIRHRQEKSRAQNRRRSRGR